MPLTLEQCRTMLQDKPALWGLASRYLFRFLPLADQRRVQKILEPLEASLLEGEGRVCRRLTAYVLKELGVEPCFHDFPREDGSRVLLLERRHLLALCEWMGALGLEPAIRRTISGAAIRRLGEGIPDVYPRMLRMKPAVEELCSAARALVAQDAKGAVSPELVRTCGMRLLVTALGAVPRPLIQRLALRFPQENEDAFQEYGDADENQRQSLKNLLFTILEHECPEGWKICSC